MLRRRLSALPILLALAGVAAPPAAATYPGANGELAYVARSDGRLVLVARSGHTVHALLAGGTIADPAYSPLGRRLAVARSSASGSDIWVLDLDGRDLRQLTPTGARAAAPTWSPAGDQVAYADGRAGQRHIDAIGAEGVGIRALTSGGSDQHAPAWSVRNRIAYVARTPRGDAIFSVGAGGGKSVRLTHARADDSDPSWSPDGTRIAFVRGGAIWVMAGNGRRAHRVVAVAAGPAAAPSWSPDGRRLAFSAGRAGHRRVYTVRAGGRGLAAIGSSNTDAHAPDWQPAGADPVIEAAGDIACPASSRYFNGGAGVPRHCGQRRTGYLLQEADLWAVLPLGDEQYGGGQLEQFDQSYGLTWGQTKALQHPILGNHEYASGATAAGYYDYFNGAGQDTGPAGLRGLGYYSYDIGAWHIVALNSNCNQLPGGCAAGSPEDQWLAADLQAHPAPCTLAYFHHPLFTAQGGGVATVRPLWETLYAGGADVILDGHHHYYDRFAPQDPAGNLDPAHGIREFIVGTGGDSIAHITTAAPHSEAHNATTFGVLRLRLRPTGYDWRFESASADPFTDAGSAACH
ncbi:MAG: hypothetical protein QOF12_717 [Solirubrobacteraceae bacterium]|nr:hypothetical protein [Solirubrobacteraceae bacterium]